MNNNFQSCSECPYHKEMLVNCGIDKLIWCPYINSKMRSVFKNAKIPKKCPYEYLRQHDKELINKIIQEYKKGVENE